MFSEWFTCFNFVYNHPVSSIDEALDYLGWLFIKPDGMSEGQLEDPRQNRIEPISNYAFHRDDIINLECFDRHRWLLTPQQIADFQIYMRV